MKTILQETSPITSAETNFEGKIKISSMVNKLIQTAWHHAEDLDFGPSFMHRNKVVWVLSALQMKFFTFPAWNNNLTLTTWPKSVERLFYLRDFEITNANKFPVALASSKWLIIHQQTKRPKLFQPENTIFSENANKHALPEGVPTIAEPEGKPDLFENCVHFSDLDLNRHLTTTRYADWMIDTFHLDFHTKHICTSLSMNFIREIGYRQTVTIKRFEVSPGAEYLFEFQSEDEKQVYFKGQLSFKSITA